MDFKQRIYQEASDAGLLYKETSRSYIFKCPSCGETKLYFDKTRFNFNCFAGKCGIKGPAYKLYAYIKNITFKEAYDEFFKKNKPEDQTLAPLSFDDFFVKKTEEENRPVTALEIPKHFFPIKDRESIDGVKYLESRGVPKDIAAVYGVMYSPVMRRVVFPIKITQNSIVGYQARAIDQVDKSERMKNNTGFQKDKVFMFWDTIKNKDFIIVAEGPFDAIKFHSCGGAVASLGKDISDHKLRLLSMSGAKRIYWALDEDANNLLGEYSKKIFQPCFQIKLPEEAKQRIIATGKEKADFGECTFDECLQAFKQAQPIRYTEV